MTHAKNNRASEFIAQVKDRVSFWQVLGLLVVALSLASFWQINELRDNDKLQSQKVAALAIALKAEQSAQEANGEEPVAPPPEQIVDDPNIIQGEPGTDGEDGQDGRHGIDGSTGEPGKPGASGKPGKNGVDGTDGEDGEPGATVTGPPGKDGKDGTNGTNGTDGKDGVDGVDGKNGEPPYGWTSYNEKGEVIYECSRVPAEEWDPERPRYECRGARAEDPIIVGGG